MTIQKLEELLMQSESEKLDFKESFSLDKENCKKEFVKDITAIANSKGGRGYIIFGIKDKTKEVVGIETKTFDEERIQQIIGSRCEPPVPVRTEEINYKDKKLLIITIFKSSQVPHQIIQTGTFYIRRGSTTDIARRYEIAGMLQDNGLLTYETTIAARAFLNDFDWKTLKKYVSRNLKPDDDYSINLLESLGFIGKDTERSEYHPTIGGLLLFGKHPQSFLISTGIRIEYNNSSKLIEGNIPTMLDKCEKLIYQIFQNTNYPFHAIYEAIYNAIVHRDYWDSSHEILVTITNKSIEIINPGAIWQKHGHIKFDNDTLTPRRNPWLYQRLLLLDKKKRFLNSPLGIKMLIDSFENGDSKVKFINLTKKNLFKVVLPSYDNFA